MPGPEPCFCEEHGNSFCLPCGFEGVPWDEIPRIGDYAGRRKPAECEHGLFPHICSDCLGTGNCKHGNASCEECGYTDKCIHKRRRYLCKECKGCGICQHDQQRYYCKECKGPGICQHDKRKSNCSQCKSLPQEKCEHGFVKLGCRKKDCRHYDRKPPALTDANLEAHDFRLEFAAAVVRSFPQKRKLSE
jgi:hypothetical protein